jgi:hypothetical protein
MLRIGQRKTEAIVAEEDKALWETIKPADAMLTNKEPRDADFHFLTPSSSFETSFRKPSLKAGIRTSSSRRIDIELAVSFSAEMNASGGVKLCLPRSFRRVAALRKKHLNVRPTTRGKKQQWDVAWRHGGDNSIFAGAAPTRFIY